MALGLSLIIAIGAQNVFVLRQGLRKEHVGIVVAICAVSDAVLIAAGVSGVGAALATVPSLVAAIRWAGAVFLLAYATLAARRAWRPCGEALDADTRNSMKLYAGSARTAVLTCLALTWLNPHVYLDTVLLLGTIASSHGGSRWVFGAGAIAGSVVWFTALGYGARVLGRWLSKPGAWRVLDGAIAAIMVALAIMLAAGA
jgi:L-lysine exporter family protein LysE/ArgO